MAMAISSNRLFQWDCRFHLNGILLVLITGISGQNQYLRIYSDFPAIADAAEFALSSPMKRSMRSTAELPIAPTRRAPQRSPPDMPGAWSCKYIYIYIYLHTSYRYMGMSQNPVPLVNIKIVAKWMFIPKLYL